MNKKLFYQVEKTLSPRHTSDPPWSDWFIIEFGSRDEDDDEEEEDLELDRHRLGGRDQVQ